MESDLARGTHPPRGPGLLNPRCRFEIRGWQGVAIGGGAPRLRRPYRQSRTCALASVRASWVLSVVRTHPAQDVLGGGGIARTVPPPKPLDDGAAMGVIDVAPVLELRLDAVD
jgi:hypothetical protein